LLRTYVRIGKETNTRVKAKAARIAINPPLSVSVMFSSGFEIPAGRPVEEAAAATELVAALDAEADDMTDGYLANDRDGDSSPSEGRWD
jgi:hypothetical protein